MLGLLVGVPTGIALGRWMWTMLADNLGVVAQPQVPLVVLAVVAVAAVLLANLIALVPGRLAAPTRPATILRSE